MNAKIAIAKEPTRWHIIWANLSCGSSKSPKCTSQRFKGELQVAEFCKSHFPFFNLDFSLNFKSVRNYEWTKSHSTSHKLHLVGEWHGLKP